MITPGEEYLDYMGVPRDYPSWDDLAGEVNFAILGAAEDVLGEWKTADPLLRALADERAVLWTWAPAPAGALPMGTLIDVKWGSVSVYRGRTRPARYSNELENPGRVCVDWIERVAVDGPFYWPEVKADRVVEALVPVPFDLSALVEPAPSARH